MDYQRATTIDYRQARMARIGVKLTIRDLAEMTSLDKSTIVKLEAGQNVKPTTLAIVQWALEQAGAEFLVSSDGTRASVSYSLKD